MGTLSIAFEIDEDWRDNMDEPAIGEFRGSIYLADDVSGIGPKEGAKKLADVAVAKVDLTKSLQTKALVTIDSLPADWVTILGFLDSDANAEKKSPRPDDGDPVTLPGENEFEVIEDEVTEVRVFFGFLNP